MSGFDDLLFSSKRRRFLTREVTIGDIVLGGNHPLRIQSMTNTDTNNIAATVGQCIELADAGCELVRITAQGEREAQNLQLIKDQLRIKGYKIPLIADIHFNPKAAEIAARIVEKVRINPGNYSERMAGENFEFTDQEYGLELERIAERIAPLLAICKQYGTAIRIGSNHGSLGKRIMSHYGDTPQGMVESALEFARICDAAGFRNLVLSMKSSNVRIMVHATRLLVHRMIQENLDFPIHLGVTEAGDGEDGIIKSAAGIGALLEDGIGDTIRVSLTGDPIKEIPVAREIVRRYSFTISHDYIAASELDPYPAVIDPFSYRKRESIAVGKIGGNRPVQVITGEKEAACLKDEKNSDAGTLSEDDLAKTFITRGSAREMRLATLDLLRNNDHRPLLLKNTYSSEHLLEFQVNAAIDFGALLIDGLGDAIWPDDPNMEAESVNNTAFGILQATRARITRTEFIACPSCGRTLFDIESTLDKIKTVTGHLKGLKIAVMGCIVNGPGEMADADYGYVGAGKGRITLYKGREVIRRNIPENEAIPALIELIKQSGDWK